MGTAWRAVVGVVMDVREALESSGLARLAAHTKGEAQPVAWRWRRMIRDGWSKWFLELDEKMAKAALEVWDEVEVQPLFIKSDG